MMPSKLLRFVSWNLQGQPRLDTLTDPSLDWHLLAFQEGTVDSIPALTNGLSDHGIDHEMVTAKDRLPPAVLHATGLTYFSGIVVRPPFHLVDADVLPVPSPERTLAATVNGAGVSLTAASLALPPGVRWGQAKPRQALLIADWLDQTRGSVVFGIDANTPHTEQYRPDAEPFWKAEWFYDDEQLLLGVAGQRRHRLQDVYRDVWLADPARRTGLTAGQPLAVSHVAPRGRGRREVVRYDAIWATSDVGVHDVAYCWDGKGFAGSDHGLVRAALSVPQG